MGASLRRALIQLAAVKTPRTHSTTFPPSAVALASSRLLDFGPHHPEFKASPVQYYLLEFNLPHILC
jgi:hypothetical protein